MTISKSNGTALRQRMIEDLQLRGLAPKTQEAYVRAVRQLAAYSGKASDALSSLWPADAFVAHPARS